MYKQKYLRYKQKYLELKKNNQRGGMLHLSEPISNNNERLKYAITALAHNNNSIMIQSNLDQLDRIIKVIFEEKLDNINYIYLIKNLTPDQHNYIISGENLNINTFIYNYIKFNNLYNFLDDAARLPIKLDEDIKIYELEDGLNKAISLNKIIIDKKGNLITTKFDKNKKFNYTIEISDDYNLPKGNNEPSDFLYYTIKQFYDGMVNVNNLEEIIEVRKKPIIGSVTDNTLRYINGLLCCMGIIIMYNDNRCIMHHLLNGAAGEARASGAGAGEPVNIYSGEKLLKKLIYDKLNSSINFNEIKCIYLFNDDIFDKMLINKNWMRLFKYIEKNQLQYNFNIIYKKAVEIIIFKNNIIVGKNAKLQDNIEDIKIKFNTRHAKHLAEQHDEDMKLKELINKEKLKGNTDELFKVLVSKLLDNNIPIPDSGMDLRKKIEEIFSENPEFNELSYKDLKKIITNKDNLQNLLLNI